MQFFLRNCNEFISSEQTLKILEGGNLKMRVMNVVVFLMLLLSIYNFIIRYRTKNRVIAKAKLNKGSILLSIIIFIHAGIFLYAGIDEFYSTQSFRENYSISFCELINDKEIEIIIDNMDDKYKEMGELVLKKIRNFKTLSLYVLMLGFLYLTLIKIGKVRFENDGIRILNTLKSWKEYKSYSFMKNEISFVQVKNNGIIKFKINDKQKSILDTYLRKNTDLYRK
jgi:hypothetical protein